MIELGVASQVVGTAQVYPLPYFVVVLLPILKTVMALLVTCHTLSQAANG